MLHYSTWSHWRLSCRRRRNSLCQTNSGRSTFSRQGFCWHISTITVVVRKWPFTRVDHFHFIIWQDTSGILQWSWHHLHRWSTNNQVTPQLRYPNVKPSPKLAINLKPIHHQISPNHHHTNFKTIFLTQTNFTVIQTTQAFSPWFSPCKIYHQKLSHQHQNPTINKPSYWSPEHFKPQLSQNTTQVPNWKPQNTFKKTQLSSNTAIFRPSTINIPSTDIANHRCGFLLNRNERT